MSGNIVAKGNVGAGTEVLATDRIAGVDYPRTKLIIGADGVNDGDVSASNPLPVSNTGIGAPADASASTDTGTFSMIALLKRMLTKMPAQGQATMANSQPVAIASDQLTVPVNQAGVSAPGAMTTNGQAVALSLTGATGFTIDLRGTWTGTVTFQGTVDGTNWFNISMVPSGGAPSVAAVTSSTANGVWSGNANGMQQVRATCTAAMTGTVTATVRAMQAAGVVSAYITGAATVPVSGTVTANIGTGALAAGTNAIGDVGTQYRATTTGAGTPTNINSPATPAGQTIKGSAGRLIGFVIVNNEASTRWLKIFNATAVTPGTTAALTEVPLPVGQPININFEGGIAFGTGIMIMITGGQGLTNNTAITGNGVNGFTVHA